MTGYKQVVIFDDEDGPRRDWEERLTQVRGFKQEFEIRLVNNKEFMESAEILKRRREEARNRQTLTSRDTFFDTTSVFIVDYDLLALNETGEDIAYLARCYSECGIIIALNQFAREGFIFDLTLQGHIDSFADLNLLVEQIFEPGLWCTPWGAFRPWYWPILSKAHEKFEQRISEVEKHLDEKILDFLEIPPEIQAIFPINALEFMSSRDATFRSFVEKSGKALRRKDRVLSDRAMARIAAARLFKCLERLVLSGQHIFVDAAHLLERYSSLFLGESADRLIDWQETYKLLDPGEAVMDVAKIGPFQFTKAAWLSRTAWYWPLVSECERISEVADPWAPRQKLAFCEDTSRFLSPDEATEFVAKVDSPFVRRFVSTRDTKYGPQLQFAL